MNRRKHILRLLARAALVCAPVVLSTGCQDQPFTARNLAGFETGLVLSAASRDYLFSYIRIAFENRGDDPQERLGPAPRDLAKLVSNEVIITLYPKDVTGSQRIQQVSLKGENIMVRSILALRMLLAVHPDASAQTHRLQIDIATSKQKRPVSGKVISNYLGGVRRGFVAYRRDSEFWFLESDTRALDLANSARPPSLRMAEQLHLEPDIFKAPDTLFYPVTTRTISGANNGS